ncbi:MAG: hypothetical protein R6X06_00690 [Gammaproteobacteria bacterium]
MRRGEVLAQLLHPIQLGGWLGLMTRLVSVRNGFAHWHYNNDPTHICFFSRDTFAWWGSRSGCTVTFIGQDVILLRKLP